MGLARSEKSGERTSLALAAGAAALLAMAGCSSDEASKLAQARAALSTETANKIAVILVTGQDPSDEFITLFQECSVQEKETDGKIATDTICTEPVDLDEAEGWPSNPYQGRPTSEIIIGPYKIGFFEGKNGLPGKIVVRSENGIVFQLDEKNGLPAGITGSLLLGKGVSYKENPRFVIEGGGKGAPIKTVFNTFFDASGQLKNITLDGQFNVTTDFISTNEEIAKTFFYKDSIYVLMESSPPQKGPYRILEYKKIQETGNWKMVEEFYFTNSKEGDLNGALPGIPFHLGNFSTATFTGDSIAIAKNKNIKVFKPEDFDSGKFDAPIAEFDCEVESQHLKMHPKGWLVGYGPGGLVIFDSKDPGKMLHISNIIGAGSNMGSSFYEFEITENGKLILANAGKRVTITTDNPFDGNPDNVLIEDLNIGNDIYIPNKTITASDHDKDGILDWKEPDTWTVSKPSIPPEPAPEPVNPESGDQPDAGSPGDAEEPDATVTDDAENSGFDDDAYNEITEDVSGLDDTADGSADNLIDTTPAEDTSKDTSGNMTEDATEDTPKVEDSGEPLDEGPKPDAKKDAEKKDAQPPPPDAETPDAETPDATEDIGKPADTSPSNDTESQEDKNGPPPVELEVPVLEQTPGNDATGGEKDISQNLPPAGGPGNADSGGCAVMSNAQSRNNTPQQKSRPGELLTIGGLLTLLRNLRKKERTE